MYQTFCYEFAGAEEIFFNRSFSVFSRKKVSVTCINYFNLVQFSPVSVTCINYFNLVLNIVNIFYKSEKNYFTGPHARWIVGGSACFTCGQVKHGLNLTVKMIIF